MTKIQHKESNQRHRSYNYNQEPSESHELLVQSITVMQITHSQIITRYAEPPFARKKSDRRWEKKGKTITASAPHTKLLVFLQDISRNIAT